MLFSDKLWIKSQIKTHGSNLYGGEAYPLHNIDLIIPKLITFSFTVIRICDQIFDKLWDPINKSEKIVLVLTLIALVVLIWLNNWTEEIGLIIMLSVGA